MGLMEKWMGRGEFDVFASGENALKWAIEWQIQICHAIDFCWAPTPKRSPSGERTSCVAPISRPCQPANSVRPPAWPPPSLGESLLHRIHQNCSPPTPGGRGRIWPRRAHHNILLTSTPLSGAVASSPDLVLCRHLQKVPDVHNNVALPTLSIKLANPPAQDS